tara:strand:- start:830 stop:1228 length:399 start_codon:yes stop_codon:yes gene_type:complete
MNKDKLICTQVAFKGAIELVVAGKIELDEIDSFTSAKTDMMMSNAPQSESQYQQPVAKPFTAGQNTPTEKQLGFINQLLKQVPKSVSDTARQKVENGLTGKGASALIELLLQEKEANEPVAKTPKNDTDAPF